VGNFSGSIFNNYELCTRGWYIRLICAPVQKQSGLIYYSGSCYIKMFFTLLNLIIHNNKLLIALFLQTLSNHDEHLDLHFLRHLCKCWYNVLLNSNELWGCKNPIVAVEHNPIKLTKFTCRCVHATFFVPWYTKRTKEATEARPTTSSLYEVWL